MEDKIHSLKIDKNLLKLYSSSDYNFACFEAPVVSSERALYKKCGPNIHQDSSVVNLLHFFSHVSLANNHSMDFGYFGVQDTFEFLKDNNVTPLGISDTYPEMYEPTIISKGNICIAVFCLCEAQYGCCRSEYERQGYAWLLNPIVCRKIIEYKSLVDYVVIFAHAGLEDVEIPLLDWRYYYRNLIDCGADLVVASHPHIIQGKESYKGKYIYYSLGNLFFNGKYSMNSLEFTTSIVLECDFLPNEILIEEHFVKFDNESICDVTSEYNYHFSELTLLLTESKFDEYLMLHNKMLETIWNNEYKYNYSFPIWRVKVNVPFYKKLFNSLMKKYVHRCFLPPVSYNAIYHNVVTDTNRFVVARLMQVMSNTY